jgi:hypothetical protein
MSVVRNKQRMDSTLPRPAATTQGSCIRFNRCSRPVVILAHALTL